MTDGGVYYGESGEELKKFNIQDGYGIVKLQRAGIAVGIITGRVSKIVQRRADELGIKEVYQNLENKLDAYERVKAKLNLNDNEVAYIGDDEFDMPVLRNVGFSAAPANGLDAVNKSVDYVCKRRGGDGAVREVVELILRSKGNGRA
ncbi:MAG: HAD hydrolase family protein [Ignavibacteriales bacterium]|nr:HAD hydrolase family protein [Ignavibacteriales bacterium]MBI3787431.1 HAD hydrolase family protein [Ignavibacteriales bacterium]